ncbi:hypothetical protein CENSYa_0882 [Cenarchaeum symbiosum A]|uniref:Uncharacterized protein n=1 Tax=Cenarchaeum symbiosum (strain A) TaxID=414004 RepID=A0RVZ7_CENSY|nr:hypothetical protein CENSYa_0882 [Cenarchaeum symbiosum A]
MERKHLGTFDEARVVTSAIYGSTISNIVKHTAISSSTVSRIVYAFEKVGIMRTHRRGRTVFVRVKDRDHPLVRALGEIAEWVSFVIWAPDVVVADVLAKHGVDYAFVGTSRAKYLRGELRNMVQVAVEKGRHADARELIQGEFRRIGIRTTEYPNETIGRATSLVYVKCFPVDNIEAYPSQTKSWGRTVPVMVAAEKTERDAQECMSDLDLAFVPDVMAGRTGTAANRA